jgi:hypothetical protein
MTSPRLADRRPVETRVDRGDGVVSTMRGPGGGPGLPHDLAAAGARRRRR